MLERNPAAFDSKYKPSIPNHTTLAPVTAHKVGCKCRRSRCLKKYCECFEGAVPCSSICSCIGCSNPANSHLTGIHDLTLAAKGQQLPDEISVHPTGSTSTLPGREMEEDSSPEDEECEDYSGQRTAAVLESGHNRPSSSMPSSSSSSALNRQSSAYPRTFPIKRRRSVDKGARVDPHEESPRPAPAAARGKGPWRSASGTVTATDRKRSVRPQRQQLEELVQASADLEQTSIEPSSASALPSTHPQSYPFALPLSFQNMDGTNASGNNPASVSLASALALISSTFAHEQLQWSVGGMVPNQSSSAGAPVAATPTSLGLVSALALLQSMHADPALTAGCLDSPPAQAPGLTPLAAHALGTSAPHSHAASSSAAMESGATALLSPNTLTIASALALLSNSIERERIRQMNQGVGQGAPSMAAAPDGVEEDPHTRRPATIVSRSSSVSCSQQPLSAASSLQNMPADGFLFQSPAAMPQSSSSSAEKSSATTHPCSSLRGQGEPDDLDCTATDLECSPSSGSSVPSAEKEERGSAIYAEKAVLASKIEVIEGEETQQLCGTLEFSPTGIVAASARAT